MAFQDLESKVHCKNCDRHTGFRDPRNGAMRCAICDTLPCPQCKTRTLSVTATECPECGMNLIPRSKY